MWWVSLSARLGNETSSFHFTTDLFGWLRRQLILIEDFLYGGVDFRGSVYSVLPEEAQWDASGMKDHNLVTLFFFICLYVFFFVVQRRI
jgi:hypothetical protein